jgi:hypothetical protein
MKACTLLAFVFVGVCLGADQEPSSTTQGREPTYQGKTASRWAELTSDESVIVRRRAALALGTFGADAKAAVPALTELLKDGDARVRSYAASALGKIGPEAKAATAALTAMLKDKDPKVQQAATEALEKIKEEKNKGGGRATIVFDKTEYLHRWSQKGQHEFTPSGQEDLSKWTDMLTIVVYRDVADAEGLASVANKVLEMYKSHKGLVLRTNSVPRTAEKPAEHLIAVVLAGPKFLEAVQARFVLTNKKGFAIIHSHRVYGKGPGPAMSDWLKNHGAALEKVLMEWKLTVPVVNDLLKHEDKQAGARSGGAADSGSVPPTSRKEN